MRQTQKSNGNKLTKVMRGKRWLLLLCILLAPNLRAEQQLLTPEAFLAEAFAAQTPKQNVLWLTKDVALQAKNILGHAPAQLRQKYWQVGDSTAWIFEEIGKEEPITAGFVVTAGKLQQVRVLVYRESRGWEVRYPAFLKQYQGLELKTDNFLSRNIDGISGATLSVNAMNRMARLALYYDQLSRTSNP